MDIPRDVDDLGELLNAADARIKSCTLDSARLQVPGVWVRVDQLQQELLTDSYTIRATAHLVVKGAEPSKALNALGDHLDALLPVLESVGYTGDPINLTGLILPGSSSPLPALAIPLALHITEED